MNLKEKRAGVCRKFGEKDEERYDVGSTETDAFLSLPAFWYLREIFSVFQSE